MTGDVAALHSLEDVGLRVFIQLADDCFDLRYLRLAIESGVSVDATN